jgi:hypothetical protein
MMSLVPQFDAQEWIKRLDLSDESLFYQSFASQGTAYEVAVELVQQRAAMLGSLGDSVPCDVYLMAIGEAPIAYQTKTGGTPYRPSHLPWPLSRDGRPMIFVAQYLFTESRDMLPALPGDVLLMFSEQIPAFNGEGQQCLQFEWHNIGIPDPIAGNECPKSPDDVLVSHGYRWRTVDYIDAAAEALIEKVYPQDYVKNKLGILWQDGLRGIRIHTGMKIGGIPFWYQCDDEEIPEGQYLCSFGNIWPADDVPYPWINRATPYPSDLHWLDGFVLNMYLQEDGSIDWLLQIF